MMIEEENVKYELATNNDNYRYRIVISSYNNCWSDKYLIADSEVDLDENGNVITNLIMDAQYALDFSSDTDRVYIFDNINNEVVNYFWGASLYTTRSNPMLDDLEAAINDYIK